MDKEKWKPIECNTSYLISNHGRIYSSIYKKVLKRGYTPNSNPIIQIQDSEGKSTYIYVYEEVAKNFCYRPNDNFKFVKHLDGNKRNNHYKNLKWVVNMVESYDGEIWKPTEFKNYHVSNYGRVKRIACTINGKSYPDRVLKETYAGTVRIFQYTYSVNRLVAKAFMKMPHKGTTLDMYMVLRKVKDVHNNSVDNLYLALRKRRVQRYINARNLRVNNKGLILNS